MAETINGFNYADLTMRSHVVFTPNMTTAEPISDHETDLRKRHE